MPGGRGQPPGLLGWLLIQLTVRQHRTYCKALPVAWACLPSEPIDIGDVEVAVGADANVSGSDLVRLVEPETYILVAGTTQVEERAVWRLRADYARWRDHGQRWRLGL
jgi:hypothetical protein